MKPNTRPVEEIAAGAAPGFVGPIIQPSSNEWGFMLLQNKTTVKLGYESKVEALKARTALMGNKNIHGVNSPALFQAIVQAVCGE